LNADCAGWSHGGGDAQLLGREKIAGGHGFRLPCGNRD
jgi:hypothetical protein